VNKTAASAAQLQNCILLHAYSRTSVAAPSCASTNTSWHNSIFGYKLRTIEAENL